MCYTKYIWEVSEYFAFLWNMSAAETAPNSRPAYMYLPNWHTNVVRYDDFSLSFMLWYPEFASICVWNPMPPNSGNTTLTVEPLCPGLIGA